MAKHVLHLTLFRRRPIQSNNSLGSIKRCYSYRDNTIRIQMSITVSSQIPIHTGE